MSSTPGSTSMQGGGSTDVGWDGVSVGFGTNRSWAGAMQPVNAAAMVTHREIVAECNVGPSQDTRLGLTQFGIPGARSLGEYASPGSSEDPGEAGGGRRQVQAVEPGAGRALRGRSDPVRPEAPRWPVGFSSGGIGAIGIDVRCPKL